MAIIIGADAAGNKLKDVVKLENYFCINFQLSLNSF